METNVNNDVLREGYENFYNFTASDFNKHLLIRTIENTVNGSQWPKSYYQLRDEHLPYIMGTEASAFMFWFIFGGPLEIEEGELRIDISERSTLLNFLMINYSEVFMRAKQYNINPFGYSRADFTFANQNEMFNTYIMRNDEEHLLLKVDPKEFTSLLKDLTYYYSRMLENSDVNFSNYTQDVNKLIEILEESAERLRLKVDEGE